MKKERDNRDSIMTTPFWSGVFLFGVLPLGLGILIKQLAPEWEASNYWSTAAFLFAFITIGIVIIFTLTWCVKSRFHGLYTLSGITLFSLWSILVFFWAAHNLMADPPFFTALPQPGGTAMVMTLGAWAALYKAFYSADKKTAAKKSDNKRITGKSRWLLTALSFCPLAVLYFIQPFSLHVIIYCLLLMVPQIIMLARLLHTIPLEIIFIPAAAGALLGSITLGFMLHTPAEIWLPQGADYLTIALGPWILFYGLKKRGGALQ